MDKVRRQLLAGLSSLLLPATATAGRPERVHRIAVIVLNAPMGPRPHAPKLADASKRTPKRSELEVRLAEYGFETGRNLQIRYFIARTNEIREGEPWRAQLIEKALAWNPDLFFVASTACAQHARKSIKRIPIVFANVQDPVSAGLVASLARPGSNVTGAATHYDGIAQKRIELAREALPKARRLVVLSDRIGGGIPPRIRDELRRTAAQYNFTLSEIEIDDEENGICGAHGRVREARPDAIVTFGNFAVPTSRRDGDWIAFEYGKCAAALQAAARAPLFDDSTDIVKHGVAFALGEDQTDSFRRAGDVAARILAGANPAEVPVDVQMRVRLFVNARSARELGIELPASILVRADQVID